MASFSPCLPHTHSHTYTPYTPIHKRPQHNRIPKKNFLDNTTTSDKMISQTAFLFTLLPLLTSAHFELHFPQSRGDNDDTQSNFPCGGLGTSNERTLVGLDGFPVSMELGHTENLLQILLGIGNDVGDAFNYELLPTIQEIGPGDFCLQRVVIPEGLNITDGTNATIQVITNAHSGGGLYNVRV